ncbi:MAG: VacJ family lipoprotein [Erythrobacter sp.]
MPAAQVPTGDPERPQIVLMSAHSVFDEAGNLPLLALSQDGPAQPGGVSLPPEEVSPEENTDEDDGNEIVVSGTYGPPDGDPLEQLNATSFRITDGVDQAIVGPIALAYEDGLPSPIRLGLRNGLRNLGEPTNFLNFLLQLKPGKAIETLGRFAINSTLGLGGLIDVAGKEGINLPYRRNGFSNTLGYYGVGHGPFLVLPLAGATTVRDFLGNTLDQSLLPFIVGRPFNTPEYGIPSFILTSLNARIEFDEELTEIRASDDPYSSLREAYLAKRQADIDELRGITPEDGSGGEDDVPAFDQLDPVEGDLDPQALSDIPSTSFASNLLITADAPAARASTADAAPNCPVERGCTLGRAARSMNYQTQDRSRQDRQR